MCWRLSIIELKNARWNTEISTIVVPLYGFLFYINSKLPMNNVRAVTNGNQHEETKNI